MFQYYNFFFFLGRGGGDAKEFGIHLFVKTRHKCRIYQETLNVEPCNYFFSGISYKYIWGMAVSAPQVLSNKTLNAVSGNLFCLKFERESNKKQTNRQTDATKLRKRLFTDVKKILLTLSMPH